MRIEFYAPPELDNGLPDIAVREVVRDVLALARVVVPLAEIGTWSRYELIIAYDWAWRRHLVASDHSRRLLRDKPEFVRKGELLKAHAR